MAEVINVGGPLNHVTGGSMNFSRQGVYSYIFVYGDNNHIETTLADISITLSGNVPLDENWDTAIAWDEDAAKTDRTKYQDHLRRYSNMGTAPELNAIDVATVTGTDKSPAGYREFKTVLTRLAGDSTELSAYGVVFGAVEEEDPDEWLQASDLGMTVSPDNSNNSPSFLFNAKDAVKEFTQDMPKSLTVTMVGMARQFSDGYQSGSDVETDFIPFIVDVKDRFRHTVARSSYRALPEGTVTNGVGVDNNTNIVQYAKNKIASLGRLSTSGQVELIGNSAVTVGDTIDTLNIFYNGAYVAKTVSLIVVSRVYNFVSDTTSLILGRP